MKANSKSKGTWLHRFAIYFFTLVLAVLVFWVLGFFVNDIQSIRGPDYAAVEQRHVSKDLVAKRDDLATQIRALSRQTEEQKGQQRLLDDSSRNLQQTINQLIELQKHGMENKVVFSETERANFTSNLNLFLANQQKYQELSQAITATLAQKQTLEQSKQLIESQIEVQRQGARTEYSALIKKHHLKLACLQLAILLPILLVAAILIIRKRSGIYFPLVFAFGAATLLKVTLVVHEHFPRQYFKYIVIGALLIVVARLLVYFIRAIAFPKKQSLIKQYREAYERFLCPVCEYPIRIGPRRFMYWTRRTVNKTMISGDNTIQEEPYTCPSCGSTIFSECPSCHKIRHSMLPFCSHCGAESEV